MTQDGGGAEMRLFEKAPQKVAQKLTPGELSQWLAQGDNDFLKSVARRFRYEIEATIRKTWKRYLPKDILEEIYNDVLVEIFKIRPSLTPARAAELGGLIYTIATKRTMDRIKKASRIKRRSEVYAGDITGRGKHGEEITVEHRDVKTPTTSSRAEVREEITALHRWAAAAYAINWIDVMDLDIIVYSLEHQIDFTDTKERRTLAKHFGQLDNKAWQERLLQLTSKVREAKESDFAIPNAA
jgi:DNA-directed RNA polymerase specialized sigma24 family protein